MELGRTYPEPIIDHGTGRERALVRLSEVMQGKKGLRFDSP
jgi:hypothetical protein